MRKSSKIITAMLGFGLACWLLAAADHQQLIKTANSYYKQRDYLNAFQLYQQALNINSDSWEANMGVGNALYKMGRSKTALSYYQRSLKLNPDNKQLRVFYEKMKDRLSGHQTKTKILSSGGISWLDNYNLSVEQANRERKFMMMLFYTEFSPGLPLLERKVFSDKDVQQMAGKFVCVRVDGNVERYLTKAYEVGGYPTIIFADGQEKEKVRGMGVREPEQLLKLMEKALKKKGEWREMVPGIN